MAVLIGSARRSTVPLSSCVGTQMRRDKAAGARTGPIEARERAMMAIAEFAEAHLEVGFCTPGRRTLQPGRETCMVDRLKTMVGHGGEVLGRGGARAALILAATRGIFEMVTVAVGQGGAVVDPVKRATEWLVAQGWVEAGGVGSLEKEARGWVRVLPPHMPVVLELGMGWMGFSDPARHAMEAEGGRVVTVDERQLGGQGVHCTRGVGDVFSWDDSRANSLVLAEGKVLPGRPVGYFRLPELHRGEPGKLPAWREERTEEEHDSSCGGGHRHNGGGGAEAAGGASRGGDFHRATPGKQLAGGQANEHPRATGGRAGRVCLYGL